MVPTDVTVPLQGLGPGRSLLLGVGGIVLGVYILTNTGGVVTRFRNVLASDVQPVADVETAGGAVELQGTARELDETVVAPHTETVCLAYDYEKKRRVEEEDFDDQSTERWEHLDHQFRAVPFRLEDDSGSAVVEPSGADVSIESDEVDGYEEDSRRSVKITERRIDPGEQVHVWGSPKPDGGGLTVGDAPDVDFRIGTGGRTRAVAQIGTQAVVTMLVGVLSLVGGTYVLLSYAGAI